MLQVWPLIKRFIVWFPLLSSGVDLLCAGYFWFVQYELNLVYGPVNGQTTDTSRSLLWPGVLMGLALLNVGLAMYLWLKQKSDHPLRFRFVCILILVFFLAPLFILGTAAIAMTAGSVKDLQQGLGSY